MINGVVFQRKYIDFDKDIVNHSYLNYIKCINESGYKGIEGNDWYLNNKYPNILTEEINEIILFEPFYNNECVGVLNDEKIIQKYIDVSNIESIKYRIILCETERKYPDATHLKWKKVVFLGYDYAYSSDDYYSAVFNDICRKDRKQQLGFEKFILNKNGLFQTYDRVKAFANARSIVAQDDKCGNLEKGDFIIYKLYEVDGLII